jgi:hypothetical protein
VFVNESFQIKHSYAATGSCPRNCRLSHFFLTESIQISIRMEQQDHETCLAKCCVRRYMKTAIVTCGQVLQGGVFSAPNLQRQLGNEAASAVSPTPFRRDELLCTFFRFLSSHFPCIFLLKCVYESVCLVALRVLFLRDADARWE